MKNTKFNAKKFNADAFGYKVARVPNLKISELKKAKVFAGNPDIKDTFSGSSAGYAKVIVRGMLDGDAVNYDGGTDIAAEPAKAFEQGAVVIGRAKGWVEKDFTYDAGGGDFMDGVARQVAEYKDELDFSALRAVLSGVFNMGTGAENLDFVDKHTLDITGAGDGRVTAVTLNDAAFKACGSNKKKFAVVIMHSNVATGLENLNLLEHLRYTDKQGISRELQLGTWSGKLVITDDNLPAENGKYTSYLLGEGAFVYEDIGAKVAYELARDPKTNGGEDTLYMRQRKVIMPFGLSYEKQYQATLSPTDAELSEGDNWSLCNIELNTFIDHKNIPIARIISN